MTEVRQEFGTDRLVHLILMTSSLLLLGLLFLIRCLSRDHALQGDSFEAVGVEVAKLQIFGLGLENTLH